MQLRKNVLVYWGSLIYVDQEKMNIKKIIGVALQCVGIQGKCATEDNCCRPVAMIRKKENYVGWSGSYVDYYGGRE